MLLLGRKKKASISMLLPKVNKKEQLWLEIDGNLQPDFACIFVFGIVDSQINTPHAMKWQMV